MQKRQEVLKRLAARGLRKTWPAGLRRLPRPVARSSVYLQKRNCEFERTPLLRKRQYRLAGFHPTGSNCRGSAYLPASRALQPPSSKVLSVSPSASASFLLYEERWRTTSYSTHLRLRTLATSR